MQEDQAAAPRLSRNYASDQPVQEQPNPEPSEHKGDSSPELNVEQGFLTASHTPSKSQLDSKAQQAGTKEEVVGSQQNPSGSSKHAQRERAADQHAGTKDRQQRHSTRDDKAGTQHDSSKAKQEAGKAAQPSNRYTEDRRRREAEAAKGNKTEGSMAEDLKQQSEAAATDLKGVIVASNMTPATCWLDFVHHACQITAPCSYTQQQDDVRVQRMQLDIV